MIPVGIARATATRFHVYPEPPRRVQVSAVMTRGALWIKPRDLLRIEHSAHPDGHRVRATRIENQAVRVGSAH